MKNLFYWVRQEIWYSRILLSLVLTPFCNLHSATSIVPSGVLKTQECVGFVKVVRFQYIKFCFQGPIIIFHNINNTKIVQLSQFIEWEYKCTSNKTVGIFLSIKPNFWVLKENYIQFIFLFHIFDLENDAFS